MFRSPVSSASCGTRTGKTPAEEGTEKRTEKAGPLIATEQETRKVRRSIGEIEAKMATTRTKTKPAVTTTSPKPAPSKYKTRTAEAKACFMKAKLQIEKSKHMKTDIKEDVIETVERLYALVKEAENDKKTGEVQKPADQTSQPSLPAQVAEQLLENNRKLDELKHAIAKQAESLERMTYAGVVANQAVKSPPNRGETLHSVVVSSVDESETGDEVLDRVRKVVDAKEGWITVQKIRKAKDRKIIMGFKTKEDQGRIKERLGTVGSHLVVEEVKNKDPLLVLRDVLSANTDEDVLKALKNQNRDVFCGLDGEESRVSIKYRKRARNPLTCHVIISTSPKVWNRAINAGTLHIDLQRVKVADQSPLVQCSRCLAYGHGRRFCQEPADVCSHCGGTHLRMHCEEWLTNVAPSCRNCVKAGLDSAQHNAFSGDCPTRQKWDRLARAAVAYC